MEEGKIDKKFNNYLFTKGDSRDPELAGIGGSLMGSFFTIIICLALVVSNSNNGFNLSGGICSKK